MVLGLISLALCLIENKLQLLLPVGFPVFKSSRARSASYTGVMFAVFLNAVSFQGAKFINMTTVKREGVSTLAL